MSVTPAQLRLLGLAEELSGTSAHLGDPSTEAMLSHLLDRVVDAVVDVTQGRDSFSRDHRPAAESARAPADLSSADRASCSALAAHCNRLATHLAALPDQSLAGQVAASLRLVAAGLQDLAQDLPAEQLPVVRQRFLRVLRRATTLLDLSAP